jgi:hypothetical protein
VGAPNSGTIWSGNLMRPAARHSCGFDLLGAPTISGPLVLEQVTRVCDCPSRAHRRSNRCRLCKHFICSACRTGGPDMHLNAIWALCRKSNSNRHELFIQSVDGSRPLHRSAPRAKLHVRLTRNRLQNSNKGSNSHDLECSQYSPHGCSCDDPSLHK